MKEKQNQKVQENNAARVEFQQKIEKIREEKEIEKLNKIQVFIKKIFFNCSYFRLSKKMKKK